MKNDQSFKESSLVLAVASEMKLQIVHAILQDQIDYAGGRFDNQHILSVDLIVSIIMRTELTEDFVDDFRDLIQNK